MPLFLRVSGRRAQSQDGTLTLSEAVSLVPPQPGGAHSACFCGQRSERRQILLHMCGAAACVVGRRGRAGAGGWELGPPHLPGPVLCGSGVRLPGGQASFLVGPASLCLPFSARALGLRPWLGWVEGAAPSPARPSPCTVLLFSAPHGAAGNCPGGGAAVSWFLLSHSEVPRCLFQSRELNIGKMGLGPFSGLGCSIPTPLFQGWENPHDLEGSFHLWSPACPPGPSDVTWLPLFLAPASWG